MLTQADVARLLDYYPATGVLIWRARPEAMFNGLCPARACAVWNTRFAGKRAGSPHSAGYIQLGLFGKDYYAHDIIWVLVTGAWPGHDIDHENLNKSDNKWSNLRAATRSQNGANTSLQRNNTSGYKGVHWFSPRNRWRAMITVERKQISLGLFKDPYVAHLVYVAAAQKYFGQFARAA